MGTCYHAVCKECIVKSKGWQKMPYAEVIDEYDSDLIRFIDFHGRLHNHSVVIMSEYVLADIAEDNFLGKDDRDIKDCEEYIK